MAWSRNDDDNDDGWMSLIEAAFSGAEKTREQKRSSSTLKVVAP